MYIHEHSKLLQTLSTFIQSHILKTGAFFLCTVSMLCQADYKEIIDDDFWTKVYPNGGKSFYCNAEFDKKTPLLAVSHIYPTASITKELDCRSERSCMSSNPKYATIISDMHNMVPVNSFYLFKLKDSVFGNLEDSNEANECGIKKRYNIIEPPNRIKGDIARILFYMHKKYDLPLNNSFSFLKAWNKNDPPSKEEIEKNKRIKESQGNENPFITDASLVEQLEF